MTGKERADIDGDHRVSEEIYATVADYAVSWLAYLDKDYNFALVNKSLADACRVPREAITGKSFFEVFPQKELPSVFDLVNETNVPHHEKGQPLRVVTENSDRAVSMDWSLVPVLDEDEEITGYVFSAYYPSMDVGTGGFALSGEYVTDILDNVKQGVWAIDENMRSIYLNHKMAQMLGGSPAELTGRSLRDFCRESDLARADFFMERRRLGINEEHGFVLIRIDGTPIEVRLVCSPLIDEEGEFKGAVALVSDSRSYLDVQNAIKAEREKYRALADSISDIFFALSRDMVITYWNKASVDFTQVEEEDAVGRHLEDIAPVFADTVMQDCIMKVMDTEEPASLQNNVMNHSGEYTMSFHIYPNDNGVSVFAHNITYLVATEKRLQESEANLRAIFDSSDHAFALIMPDKTIKSFNSRALDFSLRIWGREIREGDSMLDFIADPQITLFEEHFAQALNGEEVRVEYNIPVVNEESLWLSFSYLPVRDEDGEPSSVCFTVSDITDRKRAEEALRNSEERLRTALDFNYDWDYWLSTNGEFLYISPSCERITGYTVSEFTEDPGLMTRIIHPEDKKAVAGHLLASDETIDITPLDYRILRKDGEERWISHVCQTIYDRNGEMLGRRGTNRDITDRKKTESQLAVTSMEMEQAYEREHKIADTFQRILFPESDVVKNGFCITTSYRPALDEAEIGGDFCDLIHLSDDKLAVVIADVSGKGLKAAKYTVMVKYIVRAYANEGHSPKDVVRLLNKEFCNLGEPESFVTVFYGVFDFTNGEVVYVSAGHDEPLHYISGQRKVERLFVGGPAVGFMLDAEYEQSRLRIEKGDALLVYTDGISDAHTDKSYLGIDGVAEILRTNAEFACERILGAVFGAAYKYAGNRQHDDQTAVVIKNQQ